MYMHENNLGNNKKKLNDEISEWGYSKKKKK